MHVLGFPRSLRTNRGQARVRIRLGGVPAVGDNGITSLRYCFDRLNGIKWTPFATILSYPNCLKPHKSRKISRIHLSDASAYIMKKAVDNVSAQRAAPLYNMTHLITCWLCVGHPFKRRSRATQAGKCLARINSVRSCLLRSVYLHIIKGGQAYDKASS